MSKKYYVLYSLKEFIVPKVFKTKKTLNKYLQKNANYAFIQFYFYDQEEAYRFSSQIKKQMEQKFRIKVQQHSQTTLIDQRVELSLIAEKQRQQQKLKSTVKKETHRIIDEILFGDTTEKKMKNKKQKKQQPKEIVEDIQSEIKSLRKEQKSIREEKKLQQFEKQYNKYFANNNQQIQKKQAVKIQDSQQQSQVMIPQSQSKDLRNQEKEIVKQSEVKIKEQTGQSAAKLIQQQNVSDTQTRQTELQGQTQINIQRTEQIQKLIVAQANTNILEAHQVQKVQLKIQQNSSIIHDIETIQSIQQPVALPTQLQKQFTLLNQTFLSLPQIPLQMYQFYKSQNQYNFLYNHPLHKNSINLPYFNIQSKLLKHFTRYTQLLLQQNNQSASSQYPSTLKIYLSQRQNPGLAMVKYALITLRGQFKKMQMLGVKNTSQSQMLSLWKGLQMAKFYGETTLEIETSFNRKAIEKYKKSIDKNVREHAQNYLYLQKQFVRIEYL